jgi:outer membrane protein assembly factor BamB
VLNGPLGLWGYDPKTGKEVWHVYRYPGTEENKFGEPLPLFTKETLYTAAGRERGFLQAVKLGGVGELKPEWEVRRPGVRDVGSGVLAGDYLIFADGRKFNISAHDAKTGKMLYQVTTKGGHYPEAVFYASPLLLNGKVLCLRNDGRTYIIEPGPKLNVIRENVLSDGTEFSASPAVADGKLFLRSQTHLYCIGKND